MKRILLTGMSGTGKSTVINALAAYGYRAVDLDCDAYSEWVDISGEDGAAGSTVEPGRDWVWREDRVQELLSSVDAEVLFASGCASNMGKFLSQFDAVILLTAPADVIIARLAARTNNSYGKQPGEVNRVLELIETVEPLLRRVASHVIDTSTNLSKVAAEVLQIARSVRGIHD